MIKQMAQVANLHNKLQASNNPTQFNATLPIKLEVLEKYQGIRYMIKVGNVAMETKSIKELEVGKNYWALMGKSNGSITLSNLIKQPNLLKETNTPLKLNPELLEKFLQDGANPFEAMKQFVGERMASAESKWEFAFLSHMLMSLKHKVLTLPLHYNDEKKDGFLQLKKRKVQELEVLEFYSVFANLGATSGILRNSNEGVKLDISVMYESVARLLKNNLDELAFIQKVNINVDSSIAPLYDFSDQLLDLEG